MSRSDWWCLAGLAVAGLLIGMAYPFATWLPNRNLWFAPAAIAVLTVAFVQGVRRSPSNAKLRRLAAGGCWALLFVVAVLVPVLLHREMLWRQVRNLPMPPDAEVIQRQVELDGENNVSGFRVDYWTSRSVSEIEAMYRKRFAADGWHAISTHEFPPATFAMTPTCRRQRRCVFSRGGADLIIDLQDYVFANVPRSCVTVRGGHGFWRRFGW